MSTPVIGRFPETIPTETAEALPKPQPAGKEWLQWVLERCDRFAAEDTEVDFAEYQKRVINEAFYRGQQFRIYTSKIDGSVRVVQPKGRGAARYPHNWVRPMVRTVIAQYVQTHTELGVLPLPDGNATDHVAGAAAYANTLVDSFARLLMPMDWKIRRWMEGLFSGNKIVYSYWDKRAGIPIGGHVYKPTVKRPRFEMQDTELHPGAYQCQDCGHGGELSEIAQEEPNVLGNSGLPDNRMGARLPDGAMGSGQILPRAGGSVNAHRYGNGAGLGLPETSGLGELSPGSLAAQSTSGPPNAGPTPVPTCPMCGSQNLSIEEPVTGQLPTLAGYDDVPLGFIVSKCVPRHQLKWDHLAVQLGDSLYIRWRQRMRVEHIREVYPWYEPESGGKGGEEDWSTRADYELKHSAGNTVRASNTSSGGKSDPDTRIVDQWWWQPAVYSNYIFPADFKYGDPANPTTIPAGTKARDKWPSGRYSVIIDRHELECADEDFREHWQHTPQDLIPSQISGDGMEDVISPQRLVNRIKALWLASIENAAGAGMLFRSQYINREDLPSTPFDSAPVKSGVPEKMPLSEVAAFLQPPPVRQDIPAFEEQQRGEMQYNLGAAAPSSGDPAINQVGAGTATAARIADRGAQVTRSPELALEYTGISVLAYQWLKLFQKNAPEKIWIPFEGKNGMLEGQWFKSSDIPDSFIVTHKNASFIPKYENDRQSDLSGALQVVGLLTGGQGVEGIRLLSEAAPQLLQQIESRWDVTLDVTNARRVATIARFRIDTMAAQLENVQGLAEQSGADPAQTLQLLVEDPAVTPDPEEPHDIFVRWYQQLLMDDEMLRARAENPLKVQCVHAQIAKHRELIVMNAQREAMEQMQAQAPQMQMQQEMQAEQMQQQQGAQQEQMAQQQQMAGEQKAQDVAIGEQQAQAEHERAMERDKLKGEQQLAAAKAKGTQK